METKDLITAHVVAFQQGCVLSFREPAADMEAHQVYALTIQAELMHYGYLLSPEAFRVLQSYTREEMTSFYHEVLAWLRFLMGEESFRPFYEGFPREVMEMSESEWMLHALLHYWSDGNYKPDASRYVHAPALEHAQYRVLGVMPAEQLPELFTRFLSVNQSLAPFEREALCWFVRQAPDLSDFVARYAPEKIPFKENLCWLVSETGVIPKGFTTTDALRVITVWSGGSAMLNRPCRFKHFSRPERRRIILMLADIRLRVEEMNLHREAWLRIGEILHIGTYKQIQGRLVTSVTEAFSRLRNERIRTWYSGLDLAQLDDQGFLDYLDHLAERPGEFARRLDATLRKFPQYTKEILQVFEKLSDQISNKVLFELMQHFQSRYQLKPRSILLKGRRSLIPLKPLEPMNRTLVESIQQVIRRSLIRKFSHYPAWDTCYLDERLKDIPLPSQMASTELALKPTVRGTRIPLANPEAKTIRFYVFWHDEKGSVDLDLSATFIGGKIAENEEEQLYKQEVVNWRMIRNAYCLHSGDVRHRKGDCAEYIDLDVQAARVNGVRYVVLDVRNYDGRTIEEVAPYFGYMERELPESNPLWTPASVRQAYRLKSPSIGVVALIFDVKEKSFVYLDVAAHQIIANNDEKLLTALRKYMEAPAVSVYDLLSWHVEARGGTLVGEPATADHCFSFEDFVHDYTETLKYMLD